MKLPGLLDSEFFVVCFGQEIWYFAMEAGGHRDKAIAVSLEDLHVNSRFVMKPLQLGNGR